MYNMESMSGLVTVTGVTGVGKDYLMDRALADMPGIHRRNFGTELGSYLGTDRDQLAPADDRTHIRDAVVEVARCMNLLRPLFLSSHVVRSLGAVASANARAVESIMRPDAYVVVTASPELIHERVAQRNAGGLRGSRERSIDEISELQEFQLSVVQGICTTIGSELIQIDNTPGDTQLRENTGVLRNLAQTITE